MTETIAAHDFTIFLFDKLFYATCAESSCEEHCLFVILHCREEARGQDVISVIQ